MSITRADQLMQSGEDLLTPSWLALRFNPDFDGSAASFEQAAAIYKGLKQYGKAKHAFNRAAGCFLHIQLPHAAARIYEQASLMAREDKSFGEAAELLQKAASCYRENGNPEKAAEALCRAAKMIENESIGKAIDCWTEACDIYDAEEKEHFSIEAYKGVIGLLVRTERWDEAIKMLERQCLVFEKIKQGHNVCKACLSILILHLHRDDYVAADRAYNELLSTKQAFAGASEARLASELLDSYEQSNEEALAACLKKQTFSFLDNNIVRIARGLTVHGGTAKPTEYSRPQTTPFMNLSSPTVGPPAPQAAKGALVTSSAAELFGSKPPARASSASKWNTETENSPKFNSPSHAASSPAPSFASSSSSTTQPTYLSIELPPPLPPPEIPVPSVEPLPNDKFTVPAQIMVPASLTEASQRQQDNQGDSLHLSSDSMTNQFAGIILDELPSVIPKPMEPLLEDDDDEGLC